MPFNSETAKVAGQKSKRGPSKLLDPDIKAKMKQTKYGIYLIKKYSIKS
jgi:hypothetical protein